jgi:UDP-N-acetylglucosamine 2-epimerase (non-hydrolysing)
LRYRYGYSRFLALLEKADFIMTDGGSNQEETFYLGVPCILMRRVTERTEGLKDNVLLSKCHEEAFRHFLAGYKNYRKPPCQTDISPSRIIVDFALHYAG